VEQLCTFGGPDFSWSKFETLDGIHYTVLYTDHEF
jgi:hypothetical protein